MSSIKFDIPVPCSADWSLMTPTEQGRFCRQCEKEVFDYSGKTQDELNDKFSEFRQYRTDVCVQLRDDQLRENQNLIEFDHRTLKVWQLILIAFLFAFMLGGFSSCKVTKKTGGPIRIMSSDGAEHIQKMDSVCVSNLSGSERERTAGPIVIPRDIAAVEIIEVDLPVDPLIEPRDKKDLPPVKYESTSVANDAPMLVLDSPISVAFFESNSSVLSEVSKKKVLELSAKLQTMENIEIEIIGHTDNQGGIQINQSLSLKRAESVKKLLEERGHNVKDHRGVGYSYPIKSNASHAGRAENRRVEVIVRKKG